MVETKVHLVKEGNRAICRVIVFPYLESTKFLKYTTCSVCIDKYNFDKGNLKEWRLGGGKRNVKYLKRQAEAAGTQ